MTRPLDNRALAEEFRHLADRLAADLDTLEGDEAGAVKATLQWAYQVLQAIADGDDRAKDELLRQGQAAARLLHPSRSLPN